MIGRAARTLVRDVSGQSLVEAALVLPILLLLVLGIVEFGRAWNTHQVLTDAARAGARTAAIADPTIRIDSVEATVRNALIRASLDPDAADIQLTGVDGSTGSPARVAIEYPHEFVLLRPFIAWTDDEALVTLSTANVMRNE